MLTISYHTGNATGSIFSMGTDSAYSLATKATSQKCEEGMNRRRDSGYETAMRLGFHKPSAALAVTLIVALAAATPAATAQTTDPGSGLPVPRYVSLKSDRVNVRKGPGTDYPVAWVVEKVGLPVEIIKEFENWRQVRDSEGAEGWVLQNLLSGRRTALVAPWDLKAATGTPKPEPTPLHDGASRGSTVVELIGPGVLANVLSCDGTWCQVSIRDQRGYIEQSHLWGVYKGEPVR